MNTMILGHTGMLGSMLAAFFLHQGEVPTVLVARDPAKAIPRRGTPRALEPLDAESDEVEQALHRLFRAHRPAWVINAIGIIKPYCKDTDREGCLRALRVNALFPYRLQAVAAAHGARVLQIATDCVYSGAQGGYTESSPHDALDVYGKSKSLGEVRAPNALHIRCSIIGPERFHHLSLLEWFLHLPPDGEAQGFAHHRWNGVTTLQFARLCHDIILERRGLSFAALTGRSPVHHYVPNTTVTKYDLLTIFADVYRKPCRIRRVDNAGPAVDRTLRSQYGDLTAGAVPIALSQALGELRDYTAAVEFYP